MDTTHTDFQDGERRDLTASFVMQRIVECDDEEIQRLVVSNDASVHHTLLVVPQHSPLEHLEPGATYEFHGIVWSDPVDSKDTNAATCQQCGGQLRRGQAVDGIDAVLPTAARSIGITDTFGIVDGRTTVTPANEDETVVDDWQPRSQDTSVEAGPDYVCTDCGTHISRSELTEPAEDLEMEMLETNAPAAPSGSAAGQQTVGLATGGAKDVTNFRRNIENGYTPQPEAISDEGPFYDYYFETGEPTDADALFAPRYAAGVSEHPISGDTEQYLSVGLDSTLAVEEFERPRLDLVAVLDVSGSMSSAFDAYYYDEYGRKREADADAETKMEAARRALCALTKQLRAEDRFGVVLYNSQAHVVKPLRDVATTDMDAIRRHIREVTAGGGTNLESGFETAVEMLTADPVADDAAVERRVVFMTDMMPNTGTTEEGALTELFREAAADGIHTTFVGMGLDANAALADTLSGIRGANHYFAHSATEFERRLGEEFAYMVTPLVYDLELTLESESYEIDAVHGSPSADEASGQLLHVPTLFPSAKADGEARGGVVLVRLEPISESTDLELVASWTERDGSEHSERLTVTVPSDSPTYDHTGVRKAVALARYVGSMRSWARTIHDGDKTVGATEVDDWQEPDPRDTHERESVPLRVPESSRAEFEQVRSYLAAEMDAVGDETLMQELDLLDTLLEHGEGTREVSE